MSCYEGKLVNWPPLLRGQLLAGRHSHVPVGLNLSIFDRTLYQWVIC